MKKKMNKRGKIAIAIAILIIIIIALFVILNQLKENQSTDELKAPYEITSIEELLTYYDCEDIKVRDGADETFEKDIYLKFGEDLWTGENSNEGYFNSIILNLTDLLKYGSYRMIDSSRELVIAVLCNRENKKIGATYINGEANYFQKETAKRQATKEYKEVASVNLTINAKEIQDLISHNWLANTVNFGTLESRFEDYDIYFDEGIEVKTLGGKVYNIIFTEKYSESIVNGLKVNSTKETIENILGKPSFEDYSLIGYKGDKIYVFFSENAVSVYRIEDDYKQEEFLKLWQEFNETKNAKTFVNKITDLWQDYDRYIYNSEFVALQYSLKGIKIEFNTNGENGLILYNNFRGNLGEEITLGTITAENLPEHVYLHTDEDMVFLEEKRKVIHNSDLHSEEYIGMQDNPGLTEGHLDENGELKNYKFTNRESNEFFLIYSYTNEEGIYGVGFVSRNRTYPNSELTRHKQIYTYGWLNDEQFVYSVKGKGIYYYNAKTRVLRTLIEGNGNFKINGIEGTKLVYDDTSISLR